MTFESNSATAAAFTDPTKFIIQQVQAFLNVLSNLAEKYLPGQLGTFVSQALDSMISFMSSQLFLIPAYSILDPAIYFGPFVPFAAPVLFPAGVVGLAGICVQAAEAVPLVEDAVPEAPGNPSWPAPAQVTLAGTTPAAPTGPATVAGAPATTATAPAAPAGGVGVTEAFYAIGGGPDGEGFSPTSRTKAIAAVAAGAVAPAVKAPAASPQIRTKRKARLGQHGRKYQYAYLDADTPGPLTGDPPPADDTAAFGDGSGPLGLAGTIPKSTATQAKGFSWLRGRHFDEAPREPMLPHDWDAGLNEVPTEPPDED